MKTLLQINSVANCGSTGRIAEQIGHLAKANGWRSVMAYGAPRYNNNSQLETITCVTPFEEKINALKNRIFDNHGLTGASATRRVVRQFEALNPDIVHLHNIHGYHINYKVLFEYLQNSNCKVVWTMHDCWPFTGHCTYFDRVGCEKWKTQCHNCEQKTKYPSSLLLDRSTSNFKIKRELFTSLGDRLTLVPVSEWLAGLTRESFLKDTRIICIHNGIDLNVFNPLEWNETVSILSKYNINCSCLNGKKVLMGCASGWGKRKGYNDFIKLKEILPNDYIIIMVGCSDKQVEELSKRNIIGIKRTENTHDLSAFYSFADVFVNPTYEDNFPTTNLEALACGTPVVTYRTGGSPEAIDDDTGIVVEKGDLNVLAEACIQLATESSNMSQACQQRAERLYNKDERFADYVTLYNHLLSNNK